jgi:hypothetical protein
MAVKMLKNTLCVSTASRVLVLSAVILAQNFLPTEFSSPFIVPLGVSIMVFGKISRSYLKLVWPLIAVLVIGFMGVFGHESRHIYRDVAFALTPIALIFIGYWMAGNKGMWPLILKVMVIFSFVMAVMHLSAFVLNPELLSTESMNIRKEAGGTGDLVVLAFLLGLSQKYFGINGLFPRLLPRLLAMPVLLVSFVLSYSRTELMVGIILSLSLLGWVSRISPRLVLALAVLIGGYSVLAVITPVNEEGTFRSKIVRSATEVTIADYQDYSDISRNWRGFEAQRAVETYLSGNALQLILGQGFGTLVDLGFSMALGGEGETEFTAIPIMHNGYVYILVKAGLLGLACYAFFYISVIRYAVRCSHSTNNEQRFLERLLLGCVLSLIAVMYVVGGMAEMHSSELVLLLGYLMRRIGQSRTESSRIGVARIS